jgi:hypothetical protein
MILSARERRMPAERSGGGSPTPTEHVDEIDAARPLLERDEAVRRTWSQQRRRALRWAALRAAETLGNRRRRCTSGRWPGPPPLRLPPPVRPHPEPLPDHPAPEQPRLTWIGRKPSTLTKTSELLD